MKANSSPVSISRPKATSVVSPIISPGESSQSGQEKHSPLQNSLQSLSITPDSFVLSPDTHHDDLAAGGDSPRSDIKGEECSQDRARKEFANCTNCNSNGGPCQSNCSAQGLTGEDEYLHLDERRQKRMISNRESARRSRLRKQQHLDELRLQVQKLQNENAEMTQKFGLASQHLTRLNEENSRLRSHALDLGHKLQKLHHAAKVRNLPRSHELDLGLSHLDSFFTPGHSSVSMASYPPPIPPYPRQNSVELTTPFHTPYMPSISPELSR